MEQKKKNNILTQVFHVDMGESMLYYRNLMVNFKSELRIFLVCISFQLVFSSSLLARSGTVPCLLVAVSREVRPYGTTE